VIKIFLIQEITFFAPTAYAHVIQFLGDIQNLAGIKVQNRLNCALTFSKTVKLLLRYFYELSGFYTQLHKGKL